MNCIFCGKPIEPHTADVGDARQRTVWYHVDDGVHTMFCGRDRVATPPPAPPFTGEAWQEAVDDYHRAAQVLGQACVARLATMLAEFDEAAEYLDVLGSWDEEGDLRVDIDKIVDANGVVLADVDEPTYALDTFGDATVEVRSYLGLVTGSDYQGVSAIRITGDVEFNRTRP